MSPHDVPEEFFFLWLENGKNEIPDSQVDGTSDRYRVGARACGRGRRRAAPRVVRPRAAPDPFLCALPRVSPRLCAALLPRRGRRGKRVRAHGVACSGRKRVHHCGVANVHRLLHSGARSPTLAPLVRGVAAARRRSTGGLCRGTGILGAGRRTRPRRHAPRGGAHLRGRIKITRSWQ